MQVMTAVRGTTAALLAILATVSESPGQDVTSPYLDQVWRYRAGKYAAAAEAVARLPFDGLRERVADDLGARVCRSIAGLTKCGDLGFANPIARLSEDLGALRDTITTLVARGNTSIVDAVYAGLAHAERGRPTLLLAFSDGLDTSSWLQPDQVLEVARRSEVVVDGVIAGEGLAAITAGRGARRPTDDRDDLERFLDDVARTTGGRLFDGGGGERLGRTFIEALDAFRQRYQITYAPTGVETPGWHAIDVKVKGRRAATVRARAGYSR